MKITCNNHITNPSKKQRLFYQEFNSGVSSRNFKNNLRLPLRYKLLNSNLIDLNYMVQLILDLSFGYQNTKSMFGELDQIVGLFLISKKD